jgi:hypothetical protein
MPNITNITPPRVPLTDPRTGLIAREWYLFFLSLYDQTGGSTTSLEDIQKGPPAETVDANAILSAAQLSSGTLPSDLAPLETAIQALAVAPAYTPQLPRLRYGSFYDTTDQTAALANTAYAMTFNSTDITNGVYIGSPTSRVYVDTVNLYNIQFSAQLINTAGGAHNIWIWLRKNGTDVANSATTLRLQGNNTELVAAWNYLLSMNAGDYFELMWEVSDTSVSLFHDVATAIHPDIPSVILTVTDNISSRGAT